MNTTNWNLERIRKELVEISANVGLRIVTVGPLIAGIVAEYEARIAEFEEEHRRLRIAVDAGLRISKDWQTALHRIAELESQLAMFEKIAQPPSHIESIVCPKCGKIEDATVEHTQPWPIFVHTCTACGYIIMESEWESVD